MLDMFVVMLAIPLVSGALLTVFGEREWAPNLNIIASLGTFLASVLLTAEVVANGARFAFGEQFFIDSLNVFFVTLTAFVGLTTSIFSGPYMKNEAAHGRLSIPRLRLYKSMYQLFMFTMLVALTTNNMGILWVAMEAATLTTVLLVSLYRTPASLEAAWKYFICWVRPAMPCCGPTWSTPRLSSTRTSWRCPSFSCWSATAPRSGWRRCTTGCQTPMPKARHQCLQYFPACC